MQGSQVSIQTHCGKKKRTQYRTKFHQITVILAIEQNGMAQGIFAYIHPLSNTHQMK